MSKLPRRVAQQIGKVLVLWFLICIFSLVGLLSLQNTVYAHMQQRSRVLDVTSTSKTNVSDKSSDSDTTASEKQSDANNDLTPEDATATATAEENAAATATAIAQEAAASKDATATATAKNATATATAKAKPTATPTPKPVATVTHPIVPATPINNGGAVLPTPTTQDPTPTSDQPTPDSQATVPPQTTPPDNGTSTTQTKSPTTPRDQGTMTVLIVTGGLGMTTLLSAGVLIGVQQKRKKKQAEEMAYSQMYRPSQTEFELAVQSSMPQQAYAPQQGYAPQEAYAPHLIDPNMLNSPAMNDILQQSPDMFMANGAAPPNMPQQFDPFASGMQGQQNGFAAPPNMPQQFDPFASGMQGQQGGFVAPPGAAFEQSTALMSNYPQNDPAAANAFYTQPMMTGVQNIGANPPMPPQNGPEAASMYYTQPMMDNAQDVSGMPQNGPMSLPGMPVPLPSIEPRVRTDPRVISMQKQAQMGIFVLPGQEKQSDTEDKQSHPDD